MRSLPQIAISIAWDNDFQPSWMHLLGVLTIVGGSFGYAFIRYEANRQLPPHEQVPIVSIQR